MKNLTTLFILFSISFPILAEEPYPLTNLREGKTRYKNSTLDRELKSLYFTYSQDFLKYQLTLRTERYVKCASALKGRLQKIGKELQVSGKLLAYAMRDLNLLDDISYEIIKNSFKIKYSRSLLVGKDQGINIPSAKEKIILLAEKIKRGACPEDVFRSFARAVKDDGVAKNHQLKRIFLVAKSSKIIDSRMHKYLNALRIAKVQTWSLTLKTYLKKLKSVRKQKPLATPEYSDFITKKFKDQKGPSRKYIYAHYNMEQILLLGNLLLKMKKRLNARSIVIQITYPEGEIEDIPLNGMQPFRFCLRLLRKEMAELRQHKLFNNVSINYMAILAAAYESGFVPAKDLEELANLEELWNPQRSKWEKATFWAGRFRNVSALLLPAPYGLIPIMAMMVIESTRAKSIPGENQDFNLF